MSICLRLLLLTPVSTLETYEVKTWFPKNAFQIPNLYRYAAVLDIPVYNNLVESLHVMFTTYLEFKNNPFLQQQQNDGGAMMF
jgi:hypothetical protein